MMHIWDRAPGWLCVFVPRTITRQGCSAGTEGSTSRVALNMAGSWRNCWLGFCWQRHHRRPLRFPYPQGRWGSEMSPQEVWVEAASHLLTWLHIYHIRLTRQMLAASLDARESNQTASLDEGVVRRLVICHTESAHQFLWCQFLPFLTSEIKDIFGNGSLRFHDIFYSPGWSLLCLLAPHLFKKRGGQLLMSWRVLRV